MAKRYWLLKTEPECFSIQDLAAAPRQTTFWSGVRNFQARNFMRDEMALGDRRPVLSFQCRSAGHRRHGRRRARGLSRPHGLGSARTSIISIPKPRPPIRSGKWSTFAWNRFLTSRWRCRCCARVPALKQMELLRKGSRLSVQPVTAAEFDVVLQLAAAIKTPGRALRNRPAARRRTAARKSSSKVPAGKRGTAKTADARKKAGGRRLPNSLPLLDHPRARIAMVDDPLGWIADETRRTRAARIAPASSTRRAGRARISGCQRPPNARQFRLERLSGIGRRSATDPRRQCRRRRRRLGGRGQSAGERLFAVARAAGRAAGRVSGNRSGDRDALGICRQRRHDLRLVGRGDAVFGDSKNHASLIDGCRLSRAEVFVYPHCRLPSAGRDARRRRLRRRKLIVTDSLFSMDGDFAPLTNLAGVGRAASARCCWSTRPMPRACSATAAAGWSNNSDLAENVHVRVGTLSKALGSSGGFVAGSARLIDWLVNRARPYIFSTAHPAAASAAATAALDIVRRPSRGVASNLLTVRPSCAHRLASRGLEYRRIDQPDHSAGRGRARAHHATGRTVCASAALGAGHPPAVGARTANRWCG